MNDRLSALLEDARAAGHQGNHNWRQFREAVLLYRSKNWKWPQIWKRLVEMGFVADDPKKYQSFRSTLGEFERDQKARALTAAVSARAGQ